MSGSDVSRRRATRDPASSTGVEAQPTKRTHLQRTHRKGRPRRGSGPRPTPGARAPARAWPRPRCSAAPRRPAAAARRTTRGAWRSARADLPTAPLPRRRRRKPRRRRCARKRAVRLISSCLISRASRTYRSKHQRRLARLRRS